MDAIFKVTQTMNDSDNTQLILILFKYNHRLQDKIATHRTVHLPSTDAYVPSSTTTMITWKRKEVGQEDAYCDAKGLVWRQGNSQFQGHQTTLKLDKDY